MPLLDEEKLNKLLKTGINNNVFFIWGDDDFLKDYYCDKLITAIVPEALRVFNFHVYQDKDTDIETIFADADNLPMMAEKTCLLVRNYPLHEMNADQLKEFENKLKDVPETTVLVFFYNTLEVNYSLKKPGKWTPVINLISKYGIAAQIDHRTPAKMAKMLVSKAKDRGTTIDPDEAMYLVQCVGDDMQTLLNEFNKICAYSQGEKITKKMIDQTAVKSVEANVFDISICILNEEVDKAFGMLNELLRQKTEIQYIIGTLAGTYVNIYRYKTAMLSDKGYMDFAEVFGYKGKIDMTFNKIYSYTKKTKLSSIRKALNILAEADVKCKSTKVDDQILLTETVAKLAACR